LNFVLKINGYLKESFSLLHGYPFSDKKGKFCGNNVKENVKQGGKNL
jgi:hypothetical protein